MKKEVIVLGTIHSQHLSNTEYSLQVLEDIVRNIDPQVILAEMPPDRFEIAKEEFNTSGKITEPRINQYPEFSKVVFPLQKELNFSLHPVSAWTEEMAEIREKKLIEISKDVNRANDWNKYMEAKELTNALFEKEDKGFEPLWITCDAFDEILEIELSVFNELFNDDLGNGGWNNINEAHYKLISLHLDLKKNDGKRILIMFGAGHKGWLRRKLKTRNDILLKQLWDVI